MTLDLFLYICAFVAMVIAVKPPPTWTLNFMCLSFAFLLLAAIIGGGAVFPLHR